MDPLVTPAEVPTLIPGAPQPEQAHVTLATLWARGELAQRRVALDSLTGDALVAARTAIAARSLALKAGFGGVISLGGVGANTRKKIELGPIKVEYAVGMDSQGRAVVEADGWDALALQLLYLALPPVRFSGWFPGASR